MAPPRLAPHVRGGRGRGQCRRSAYRLSGRQGRSACRTRPRVPVPMRASRAYVIISTPRSGSTLLCRGLASTNLAGIPEEYFNPDLEDWARRRDGVDPAAYVEWLLSERVSPNGVFGA